MTYSYNREFYQSLEAGVRQSATEIVPLILELIQPRSVADVGCGSGTWLSVFKEFGVQDCLGIDGDYVLEQEILQISPEEFLACDIKLPINIDRRFDLVVSLEVAEHLESQAAAVFIDSLTQLSSVVVFSAAIPYQGGTHHVNEQWPEYWIDLFKARDYSVIDCLRSKIWNNDQVEHWYAQNILIFANQDGLARYPSLARELENTTFSQLAIVHPKTYLQNISETRQRTPVSDATVLTSTGVELRLNENRFGSLELEITTVHLLNLEGQLVTELDSGNPLRVEIEYLAPHPISAPIFSLTISCEDGLVCYDTNTQAANMSLPPLQGQGRIILHLERLDLNGGQYYIDVGVYEQSWAYTYDYHWHVYPLLIHSKTAEKGILSPPRYWEIGSV